jgi:hypothetical protein
MRSSTVDPETAPTHQFGLLILTPEARVALDGLARQLQQPTATVLSVALARLAADVAAGRVDASCFLPSSR